MMTGILKEKGDLDTERKKRRPWEAGDRNWSDVSIGQETPRIADSVGSKKRGLEWAILQSPRKEQPCTPCVGMFSEGGFSDNGMWGWCHST